MGAGQHVLDETFMTRNVNKANAHVAEIEIGKTNIDSDAAPLLFRQAIGIDAGQRAHQRGLTVIDVAGSADDD